MSEVLDLHPTLCEQDILAATAKRRTKLSGVRDRAITFLSAANGRFLTASEIREETGITPQEWHSVTRSRSPWLTMMTVDKKWHFQINQDFLEMLK